jgi:hypothetical protein
MNHLRIQSNPTGTQRRTKERELTGERCFVLRVSMARKTTEKEKSHEGHKAHRDRKKKDKKNSSLCPSLRGLNSYSSFFSLCAFCAFVVKFLNQVLCFPGFGTGSRIRNQYISGGGIGNHAGRIFELR